MKCTPDYWSENYRRFAEWLTCILLIFTASTNVMIDAQTFRALLDIMYGIQGELGQQVITSWVFSGKKDLILFNFCYKHLAVQAHWKLIWRSWVELRSWQADLIRCSMGDHALTKCKIQKWNCQGLLRDLGRSLCLAYIYWKCLTA